MRQPGDVLWMLTKRTSSFIRQPAGSKSRRDQFSADPLNLTGYHNASSAGSTQERGYGLQVVRAASKSGKTFRREYHLLVGHKSHHKTGKKNLKSKAVAGNSYADQVIKRGTAHTAKTIQGLTQANSVKKQHLLRRLGRLHASSGTHAKGTKEAAKK